MPIIYADQMSGDGVDINMSPATIYSGVINFATILDNIANGEIPVASGRPFPVNWKSSDDDMPWYPDKPNTNPWQR